MLHLFSLNRYNKREFDDDRHEMDMNESSYEGGVKMS